MIATSGGLFPLSTGATTGGLFGGPPKPAGDPSAAITTTIPAAGGFFGLPPKPADSTTTSTSTSTTTPAFGGGLFGVQKPETSGASTPVPPTTGGFSFGGTGGTTGGGLFGTTTTNKDATKPEDKKDVTPITTTSLFGLPKDGEKKDGAATGTSTATSGSTLGGLFAKPEEKKDTPTGERASLILSPFL